MEKAKVNLLLDYPREHPFPFRREPRLGDVQRPSLLREQVLLD